LTRVIDIKKVVFFLKKKIKKVIDIKKVESLTRVVPSLFSAPISKTIKINVNSENRFDDTLF